MLAIQPTSSGSQKCTPNLLPARLNHNGPINATERYWKPESSEDGKPKAYFRGRHLHGTPLPLPSNYTGAILHITDKNLPAMDNDKMEAGVDDEEESEKVEVKVAEQVGTFGEVMLWEHGGAIDKDEDTYTRGIGEWIGFAEAMHVEPVEKEKTST
ncbi:ribonuclease H1 small subunit [Lojkania enalia]|uniref:Ribonuclease H1 small subunit n=1 Tax=Lojkania enalia TaxID=147567 RepID=A0A9P4KGR9_9PLEO|nr:ribonuclease H1 small subunit [Didymosphaeria enalia]